MNGEPPRIEVAYWLDGELQLYRTYEISRLGLIPNVGDILTSELHEFYGPLKVRRRVFVPMTADRDIWWLVCDQLPDDREIDDLLVFDKEMRIELKALEDEARREEREEAARRDKVGTWLGKRLERKIDAEERRRAIGEDVPEGDPGTKDPKKLKAIAEYRAKRAAEYAKKPWR